MVAPLIPAIVVGGATYALVSQPGTTAKPGPTQYSPSYGSTTNQQLTSTPVPPQPKPTGSLTAKLRMVNLVSVSPLLPKTNWSYADQHNNIDPEYAQKLSELEKYAEQQFNNMDEVARAQAADTLNKELKLDPPLNGHEDWKTVAAVAGGAAGALAGAAVCGPICGKVGSLVGAYLGVKLEDAIAKNYEDMKAWCREKWGDLKDAVEDAYDEVKNAVGDAIDFINPF